MNWLYCSARVGVCFGLLLRYSICSSSFSCYQRITRRIIVIITASLLCTRLIVGLPFLGVCYGALEIVSVCAFYRGVATVGGYIGIYTPPQKKSAQVNFL